MIDAHILKVSSIFTNVQAMEGFSYGVKLAVIPSKVFTLLAQAPTGGSSGSGALRDNFGKIVGIMMAISLVLAFGAMTMGIIAYMGGRYHMMKVSFVGAALAGLSWTIVKTFFQAGAGTTDLGIDVQTDF